MWLDAGSSSRLVGTHARYLQELITAVAPVFVPFGARQEFGFEGGFGNLSSRAEVVNDYARSRRRRAEESTLLAVPRVSERTSSFSEGNCSVSHTRGLLGDPSRREMGMRVS